MKQINNGYVRFLFVLFIAMIISGCVSQQGSTVQSPASSQLPAPTHSSTYLIGAEDVLNISVWKEPELNREVTVRPDGGVSFPLVGDIQVKGKTVDEVKTIVSKKISKYIPKAEVTVSLIRASSYKIYVLGKVNKPGQYVLGSYVDVLQSLSLASGLTPYANSDEIKILRRIDGKEIVFPFHYSEVSSGARMNQNIVLQSGDVVLVP